MSTTEELRELAVRHGVLPSYRDASGRDVQVGDAALLAVLQALDVPIDGLRDVRSALVESRREAWIRGIEPVTVQWDGTSTLLDLRLRAEDSEGAARIRIERED
jgi:hypothetical protein